MTDRNSRRDFLKGIAGSSVAAAGFHSTVSAQAGQQVRIERGIRILDLAQGVPIRTFDQTDNGALAWIENGSLAQRRLPLEGSSDDVIPAGLCWVATTEPFSVQVTLSDQPTTGTVSATGEGWVGLHLDEELSYGAFEDCGTEPTAYAPENGEMAEISLAGTGGSLDPGLYFVETDGSCTISVSDSGGSSGDASGTLTFDGKWSLLDLASDIPISEFADASRRSYASWTENGNFGQTWLHPDKASVERIPSGVVLFRMHEPLTVSGEVDSTPTSGPVSVGGDGWVGLNIDSPVPHSEFCGEDATVYTVDSRGDLQTRDLSERGELGPGTYLAKVDPPCTISLDGTGGGDSPSGTPVVDIDGASVPDATVLVYDRQSGDVRRSHTTGASGTLPTAVDVSGDTLVVVKKDGWFTVYPGSSRPDELVLNRQVLSYPTRIEAGGDTYGTASLWREVDPDDHRQQVLYPEVVDVNENGSRDTSTKPYEIMSASAATRQTHPDSGIFTISYPESKLWLDRPQYSTDKNEMSPDSATVLGQFRNLKAGRGLAPIERWHPLRTSLPAYPFPTASSGGDGFTELGGDTGGQEKAKKLAQLGLGMFPGVGQLQTIAEASNLLFGDALQETRRFGNYNIDDEVSVDEYKAATNPATHDSMSTSWKPGDSAPAVPLVAATQALPVTVDQSADRCSVIVRASWSPWYGTALFSSEKTLWPIRTAPGE